MKRPIPKENELDKLVYRYRDSDKNSFQPEAIEEARKTEPEPRGVKFWDRQVSEAIKHAF